jgi:hypothetical protein
MPDREDDWLVLDLDPEFAGAPQQQTRCSGWRIY